jgi:hypothetical protein
MSTSVMAGLGDLACIDAAGWVYGWITGYRGLG